MASGASRAQDASAEPSVERWLTRGYGYLIEVEGDRLRPFEHCALGDLPMAEAERVEPGSPTFSIDGESAVFQERADGTRAIRWGLTSHPVPLVPTEITPRIPSDARREDPRFNFEWFCTAFAEHYAFFDVHGVDRQELTDEACAGISASTSPEELFDTLAALIRPLQDGHCSVSDGGRRAGSGRPDEDPVGTARQAEQRRLIDGSLLLGEKLLGLDGDLVAARLLDEVGYLRIDAMQPRTSRDIPEALADLNAALDRALVFLEGIKCLVIDLRMNGWGMDLYGFELVARLIRERTLAVVKEVRCDPADAKVLQLLGDYHVEPSERPGFRGPLALLVSRHTASAAEDFAMPLLQRTEPAVIFGEQSASGFSDLHGRGLPNGWSLSLSNEVYRLGDGRCFEGIGLPLDIEIPTLRATDLDQGTDPALETAVEWALQAY